MDSEFTIRYDIPDSEIQIDALIESLTSFKHAITEIHQFHNPGGKFEINIKAIRKGSFVVFLGLYLYENADLIKGIVNRDNVQLASSIVTTLVNSIKLKSHLNGRKPKAIKKSRKGDDVTVENQDGQTIIINAETMNFYGNSSVASYLANAFKAAQKEKDLNGIELLDSNDEQLAMVQRSEMEYLLEQDRSQGEKRREVLKTNAILNATKLTWDEKHKWSFIYEGQKINARITDELFFERINKGEQFAKGDTLDVDLRIEQEFNEDVNAYLNVSYEVIRVNKHTPRGKQLDIEF